MTIKQIVSTAAVVLALAVPAIAQEKEATASFEALAELKAFAFAQNDPDRAAERAEAARQRAEEARQRNAERAAAQAAARAEGRGAGAGIGRGPFTFVMPGVDPDAVYDQAPQAIGDN